MRFFPVHRGTFAVAGSLLALSACTVTRAGHGEVQSSAPSNGRNSSGQPSTPTTRTGEPLKFGACGAKAASASRQPPPADRRSKLRYTCAALTVPLDHAHPSGPEITIVMLKAHYTESKDATPLLLNRGGPGAGGVDFAISQAAAIPLNVLQHHDLIGFDPRGVGYSSPVRCYDTTQKDVLNAASPDMSTNAGFEQAKAAAAKFAHTCSAKYGSALAYYNTTQTAQDMDSIRQALGQGKLDYLGFSYGTELGAQYAHLYPKRVGSFVLDGAVDPLTDPITSFTNQLHGFEDAFDQFASWCKTRNPCNRLGDAHEVVYEILSQASRTPLLSSQPGETRKVTPALADLGVLSALYSKSLWPPLAQGLLLARQGDGSILLELADLYNEREDGKYTNVADANITVSCNDQAVGPSDTVIRTTAKSWFERFPLFGRYNAPQLFQCQVWQPHRAVLPLPTAKDSATRILVVGNVHDPATPYRGTKDLATVLGNATVLTWDGEGHTSFEQGSSCIDTAVAAYLDTSRPPAVAKTCPA